MTYRLVHLHFATYGVPTTLATIDYAVGLAKDFTAAISVTSPRLDVKAPSHFLAGRMLAGVAAELEASAAGKAGELDEHVQQRAAAEGVSVTITPVVETWPQQAADITAYGRASDVCVLTLPRDNADQRLNVESWIFGAGRPCILVPESCATPYSVSTCCIAWDGSKSAARSVGDALPLLKRSKRIIALTGRNEKPLAANLAAWLDVYLKAHGLAAEQQEFDVTGQNIGDAILSAAEGNKADALIIGAFGHSRLREFILGGATRRVLDAAALPLIMSH